MARLDLLRRLRGLGRGAAISLAVVLLALLAVVGWAIVSPSRDKPGSVVASRPSARVAAKTLPGPPATARAAACEGAQVDRAALAENARTIDGATWSPFGRSERGWRIYAPLVAREIGADCPPESAGFAQALATWRAKHALVPAGVFDEPTLRLMGQGWLLRRPFVRAMRSGCPPSPSVDRLQEARHEEGYSGKQVAALAPALLAYRRMVAQARADSPEIARDPRLLTIFSGYRGPTEEAARCARGGCNSLTKARCSAHRTGTALDLFVGAAPGSVPESSDDANRRFQVATPAYRWLVAHADQFGFVPYAFEPWHWEWAGDPGLLAAAGSTTAQRTPRMNANSVR